MHSQQHQIKIFTASHIETPLGTMLAVTDATDLYILKFIDQNNLEISLEQLKKSTNSIFTQGVTKITQALEHEITAYFNGTLKTFTIPTNSIGTTFQQKSWHALTQIPYGTTTSYGNQAVIVGNSKAYRAVANANRNNPIAIIIPCHRIIKSNGDLCGYNGGVHRKQSLLKLEQKYK